MAARDLLWAALESLESLGGYLRDTTVKRVSLGPVLWLIHTYICIDVLRRGRDKARNLRKLIKLHIWSMEQSEHERSHIPRAEEICTYLALISPASR